MPFSIAVPIAEKVFTRGAFYSKQRITTPITCIYILNSEFTGTVWGARPLFYSTKFWPTNAMFTIFSQQILSDRLLLVDKKVISIVDSN